MLEMFKDKKMQKSMALSAGTLLLLVGDLLGLMDIYPWKWLNILAWVLSVVVVFVFFTIMLGFLFYEELYDKD